uniref:Uncharacterized protein n=1 Tax=Hucho hucho TaxID=62062 RepID=A0A4W5M6G2_9TELE
MLSKVLAAAAFYTDLNLSTFFCPCSLLFLFFLLSPLPDVHAPPLCCILASLSYHIIRWRLSGMHSYNPEQIMLSAAVRRSSRDLNIMKEKLIFSEVSNGVGSAEDLYMENGFDYYNNEGISH